MNMLLITDMQSTLSGCLDSSCQLFAVDSSRLSLFFLEKACHEERALGLDRR